MCAIHYTAKHKMLSNWGETQAPFEKKKKIFFSANAKPNFILSQLTKHACRGGSSSPITAPQINNIINMPMAVGCWGNQGTSHSSSHRQPYTFIHTQHIASRDGWVFCFCYSGLLPFIVHVNTSWYANAHCVIDQWTN